VIFAVFHSLSFSKELIICLHEILARIHIFLLALSQWILFRKIRCRSTANFKRITSSPASSQMHWFLSLRVKTPNKQSIFSDFL